MATINLQSHAAEADQARNSRRVDSAGERPFAARPSASSATSNSPTSSDAVQFSERAESVRKLVSIAQSAPEIRRERVDQFQSRINNRSYDPASDDVAASIMRAA